MPLGDNLDVMVTFLSAEEKNIRGPLKPMPRCSVAVRVRRERMSHIDYPPDSTSVKFSEEMDASRNSNKAIKASGTENKMLLSAAEP